MGSIKKLPAELVSKIAAGEVVERPLSVVKELVENSLDAGATQISVEILNGGIDLIRISDNGSGMDGEDLLLATQLHTTSKLSSIEDLESISSFGFRGEALASISAVADVEIVTSKSEALAWNEGNISPASRSRGTTITVKSLFRKVPARRKFLKSSRSEESGVRSFLKAISCARPEVSFEYIVDSKEVFSLKSASFETRCAWALGLKADDLYIGSDSPESLQGTSVQLALAHPRLAQKRPSQIVIVNGRVVKDQLIASAIRKGYETKLPADLRPAFVAVLNFAGGEVDVNVHPRKEEIKFSDEKMVFGRLLRQTAEILSTNMRSEFESRFAGVVGQNENRETAYTLPKNENSNQKETSGWGRSNSGSVRSTGAAIDFTAAILREKEPVNDTKLFEPSSTTTSFQTAPVITQDFLQIFNTYILFDRDDSLIMVDQHAADERVKYDRLLKQHATNGIETAPLLLPMHISLDLKGAEPEALLTSLQKLGFDCELFGQELQDKQDIKINSIPALLLDKNGILGRLEKFFDELMQEVDLSNLESEVKRAIATMACHGSIRAGQKLEKSQITKLISDLWDSSDPYTCPHGRPIVWEVSRSEIEKKFYRIK